MRRRPHCAARSIATLLAIACASASGAQTVASLDAGYAYVRFAGFQGSSATTLVPALEVERRSVIARGTASFARFESGRWSSSTSAGISGFSPAYRAVRGEVALSGNATAYRGTRTAQTLAQARVHVHGDSLGGWLGAGLGRSRYGREWEPHTLLDAGAWARARAVTVSVSLASAAYSFHDSTLLIVPTGEGLIDTTYGRFRRRGYLTDAVGRVAWARGPVDLDLSAGFRPIARYVDDRKWAALTVMAWLRPTTAVVGTIGRQPENPLQNLAGLHYASLSVRIGSRARARAAVPADAAARATDFTVIGTGTTSRTIYVQAPGARSVELASAFTDWTPRALSRVGRELWVLAHPIADGTYDVVIRVDGGAWGSPPGLPAFDDDFNGRVGRLVIGPAL